MSYAKSKGKGIRLSLSIKISGKALLLVDLGCLTEMDVLNDCCDIGQ